MCHCSGCGWQGLLGVVRHDDPCVVGRRRCQSANSGGTRWLCQRSGGEPGRQLVLGLRGLQNSSDDGAHIQTLEGGYNARYPVTALTIDAENKLYSGHKDGVIRVWSCADNWLLHTLPWRPDGFESQSVKSLLVGCDGSLFSSYEARRPDNPGDVRRLSRGCPVLPTRIVGSRFLIW